MLLLILINPFKPLVYSVGTASSENSAEIFYFLVERGASLINNTPWCCCTRGISIPAPPAAAWLINATSFIIYRTCREAEQKLSSVSSCIINALQEVLNHEGIREAPMGTRAQINRFRRWMLWQEVCSHRLLPENISWGALKHWFSIKTQRST